MSRRLPLIVLLVAVAAGGAYLAVSGNKSAPAEQAATQTNVSGTVGGAAATSSASSLNAAGIAVTNPNTPTVLSFSNGIAPTVDAKAWMVMDMESGQIIAQHEADTQVAPASLTKLMTASLVFSALDDNRLRLEQEVTVSERAWKTGGSRTFIEVNKQVSVADLLQGMIVQSGNDATIQLAEVVAGSVEVFVDQMNREAQAFGMSNSRFADPTGLPLPETYTTVRDLSLLAQHIIRDHPKYYHYFSQQDFTFNKITQKNRNGLLARNIGVDGLKTGHTDDAGYCLISTAVRDGRRVLSIVVGTKTVREREQYSQTLLDWGYQNFTNRVLAPAGQALLTPRVYEGTVKTVELGAQNGVAVTVPRGEEGNVQTLTQINNKLVAPIAKGEVVGSVQFVLNGKILKQDPLIALNDVEPAGFFGRMWDKFLGLF
ncbi:MAG: D-alanyl-D-alanine carboxypeptidase family protein [Pelistega sp.]|nr:D-alanyl-D-alanine carboxypeptidase family protein [Pelistega sp.]